MARTSTVTKQDIINDVHRVAANHDGAVRAKHYIAEGAFALGTVKNLFGASKNETFNEILAMDATDDAPDMSTVRMLVKKFAKQMGQNGIELTEEQFDTHAGISSAIVESTFGSFAKGLADSGYVVGEVVEVAPRKKRCDAKDTDNEVTEVEDTDNEVTEVEDTPVEVDEVEDTTEDTPVEVDEVEDTDTPDDEYEYEYEYVYYDDDTDNEGDEWDEDDTEYAEEWNEDWGEYPADEDMEFDSGIDWGDNYDENAPVDMNGDILSALQNALA